jgi:Putative peptidoglycan binding domain
MPRRRRGANTKAIEADPERGLAMRILLHSPKDMVAGALAFAAASAIIANALFLQAGRHPSPMFGPVVAAPAAALAPANPLPRPRPVEADLQPSEPKSAESRSAESKSVEPKLADPMANLVKATGMPAVPPPAAAPATAVARPPAPIPAPTRTDTLANSGARRVAAVQRALTEYGYGQLKPTGAVGSDTQAAISKFERERKMPITGQMSDRLVHELSAMIGQPIDGLK